MILTEPTHFFSLHHVHQSRERSLEHAADRPQWTPDANRAHFDHVLAGVVGGEVSIWYVIDFAP